MHKSSFITLFVLTLFFLAGMEAAHARCVAVYANSKTGVLHFNEYTLSNQYTALRLARRDCHQYSGDSSSACYELGWACHQYMSVVSIKNNNSYIFFVGYDRRRNAANDEALYKCEGYWFRRQNRDGIGQCGEVVTFQARR